VGQQREYVCSDSLSGLISYNARNTAVEFFNKVYDQLVGWRTYYQWDDIGYWITRGIAEGIVGLGPAI